MSSGTFTRPASHDPVHHPDVLGKPTARRRKPAVVPTFLYVSHCANVCFAAVEARAARDVVKRHHAVAHGKLRHPSPTAATVPAISWPNTRGAACDPVWIFFRSVPHTPHVSIRTSTSPGADLRHRNRLARTSSILAVHRRPHRRRSQLNLTIHPLNPFRPASSQRPASDLRRRAASPSRQRPVRGRSAVCAANAPSSEMSVRRCKPASEPASTCASETALMPEMQARASAPAAPRLPPPYPPAPPHSSPASAASLRTLRDRLRVTSPPLALRRRKPLAGLRIHHRPRTHHGPTAVPDAAPAQPTDSTRSASRTRRAAPRRRRAPAAHPITPHATTRAAAIESTTHDAVTRHPLPSSHQRPPLPRQRRNSNRSAPLPLRHRRRIPMRQKPLHRRPQRRVHRQHLKPSSRSAFAELANIILRPMRHRLNRGPRLLAPQLAR